ncbi:MAG TPA: branched-chain amino acid ABC transporter substrate-binding protein [Xanthobacteraceae bacterium]|jgi:branched-chain amino acid transport system substrate-binding protein|uniref:branched-chain amino acid ABC transporter substrate-binding protein n=1 Tax=Roseixanthobacter finlandensis TaxID=3119922 RepID=UPI000BC544A0|nr:MAG: branched chain amino acid ABC transporter substrate-binding protein [Rhizobiales bacterium 35-66-30]OZB06795.1 MAG: branched chain amino acid ABC transporter substrate-binding protein [Rhizobiales bacterium 39-66-18]HQS08647.1 branched-chain amino acid ABC transporter substrate-binding protein [Xanthobacteraceae bacterium]HQS48184.1 branched-chain amino acid ABC transporter substrate-binding protein [Xanthobacteraceae bacterium]
MRKLLLAGLAVGAGLALAAAGTIAYAQTPLKMGAGGPMTGPNAAFGAQIKTGVEQAVTDINAAGGINGQKIELSIGDDASKPEQGKSAANKFISDGVKYVVGHFNSGVSIPTSTDYEESGVLQISPASTNPQFTERKMWNTFRTCGRDDQQGAVAGDYIVANFKDKKVAIVHDKTPYGKGLADETQKAMNKGGVKEVLYEGINPGEKDYSALVSKLKAAGVDLVYFGGLHPEAGLIVRQMRDQGLKSVLFSGDGITDKEFWSIAGPGAAGTLMTFGPDPRKNPAAKEVVDRFKAKGVDPEGYVLYSYAAVQIIKQAAEATKSTDPKKLADYMHSGATFQTVLGPLSFDKKGDITKKDYVVYIWKDGAYSEI